MSFHGIQSFFVDKTAVGNSTQTGITSISLYCKSKPNTSITVTGTNLDTIEDSGVVKPGVSLYIVPVSNNKPSFSDLSNYPVARRLYDDITTSNNATVATNFVFTDPVTATTDTFYAFVLVHDYASDFKWHGAKAGDVLIGTNIVSPGATGTFQGDYFGYATSLETAVPITNYDLKFKIYCARYANNGTSYSNTNTTEIRNKHVEFIVFNELNSDLDFAGNEYVYQEQANATGTVMLVNNSVTVTGNGTTFQTEFNMGADPEYAVFSSGANRYLRQIVAVTSNTALTVDSPLPVTNASATFYKTPIAVLQTIKNSFKDGGKTKIAILNESTANSTLKFVANNRIVGEISGSYLANVSIVDIPLNGLASILNFQLPSGAGLSSTVTTNYTLAVNGSTIVDATPFTRPIGVWKTYEFNRDDNAVIPSWTNEIGLIGGNVTSTALSNSIVLNLTSTLGNDFTSPQVFSDTSALFYYRYHINNDYTNEHTKYGNAYAKHISKKVTLQDENFAEDMLVFLTAVRPVGTDIKTYVKFYNSTDSEAFDDKEWTLLENREGSETLYSSNTNHQIELTYGLRQYPNSAFTLDGTTQTTFNESNVIGSGTTFNSNLAVNNLVKIYPALFPNNYVIGVVNSVTNATHFTLKQPISNVSVTGSGLKVDKVEYKYQAFSNKNNDNVVRYYNTNMIEYDTFDSFALKLVSLSNTQFEIPKVVNIRVAPVSA